MWHKRNSYWDAVYYNNNDDNNNANIRRVHNVSVQLNMRCRQSSGDDGWERNTKAI